ncbi:hypothetical protein Tco_0583036 [Tanacetum coccineum]
MQPSTSTKKADGRGEKRKASKRQAGFYSIKHRRKVLDENFSSTEQINYIQQMIAYCLITGTEVDIGEIIYSDLVTRNGAKYQDIQAYLLFEDELAQESDEEEVFATGDDMKEDT